MWNQLMAVWFGLWMKYICIYVTIQHNSKGTRARLSTTTYYMAHASLHQPHQLSQGPLDSSTLGVSFRSNTLYVTPTHSIPSPQTSRRVCLILFRVLIFATPLAFRVLLRSPQVPTVSLAHLKYAGTLIHLTGAVTNISTIDGLNGEFPYHSRHGPCL